MNSRQPSAAYFDVDGTVTPLTTMFELLLFDAAGTGRMREGSAFLSNLRELKHNGAPRSVTNRKYFTWWAGRRRNDVEAIGREWFHHALAAHGEGVVHREVGNRLLEHEALGDRIVLVSGSFLPALTPLAEHIGADDILASEPEVIDGVFTGVIATPMISMGKAAAVRTHAKSHGIDLRSSYAYGDDSSDLPFMELTGNPVIVGSPRSIFSETLGQLGWPLIPIT